LRFLIALASLAALAAGQVQPGVDRVIFDTDCAYFNDDGAALVMLLQKPDRVNILGLTVVPGNLWPLEGAEDMFRILDVMKKGAIPLYLGAGAPLVHTRVMAEKENHDWGPIEYLGMFGQDPPEKKQKTARRASHRSAVDFLTETIDREPGEVTLLAIGPMTNIAIALRMRPDLETKIKRIVFMGGAVHVPNYDKRAAEFNFWFDPEAASIVLHSAIKEKIMFGLDICNHAQINKTHYDQIVSAKTPVTELFKEDMAKRFKQNPDYKTYIWDCLAAAYLLDQSFVTKRETAYLDVDTTFGANYGAVKPLDRAIAPDATPVEVMLDLDFPKFFALYKSLLTQPVQ
jgi:inosine-uridine nucleoside N-ribohydrolase